ncbi:hypothetical protein [Microbacterium sp. LMI1-1-1.1]|uniref:hypothetical protein n=1 Tax=Microbacterium sp. LMI1-1-1.1 TaxID=3135223 RepID=UPI0034677325
MASDSGVSIRFRGVRIADAAGVAGGAENCSTPVYDPTEDLAAQRIMSDDPASAAPESDG